MIFDTDLVFSLVVDLLFTEALSHTELHFEPRGGTNKIIATSPSAAFGQVVR